MKNKELFTPEQAPDSKLVLTSLGLDPAASCGVFFDFCTPLGNKSEYTLISLATFENNIQNGQR